MVNLTLIRSQQREGSGEKEQYLVVVGGLQCYYVCLDVGVLPLDVAEMAMDESCCEVHTDRDRDPIVRVDDPDYETRYSKSTPCCCRSTMTWQRRLFLVAGSVALLTAAALLAILIFLVVTRP